jgi:hypothetical protein
MFLSRHRCTMHTLELFRSLSCKFVCDVLNGLLSIKQLMRRLAGHTKWHSGPSCYGAHIVMPLAGIVRVLITCCGQAQSSDSRVILLLTCKQHKKESSAYTVLCKRSTAVSKVKPQLMQLPTCTQFRQSALMSCLQNTCFPKHTKIAHIVHVCCAYRLYNQRSAAGLMKSCQQLTTFTGLRQSQHTLRKMPSSF